MKINKKTFRKPKTKIQREIIRSDNIAKARLGKARKGLMKIINYRIDLYEDFDEVYLSLQSIAREAIREMNNIGKNKQ